MYAAKLTEELQLEYAEFLVLVVDSEDKVVLAEMEPELRGRV